MKNGILTQLQGMQIRILELKLEGFSYNPVMLLKILFMETEYVVKFYNVSNINIQNFSFPFDIGGFEIRNNMSRGWDNSLRYTVCDFEDNSLCFYCEEIQVLS